MMRDLPFKQVGARAVDVGYFNVKYTMGRHLYNDSTNIKVGMFPSLAPMLSTNVMMHSPGTLDEDPVYSNVRGFQLLGEMLNSQPRANVKEKL